MTGYGKNWQPSEHYKNANIADNYDRERFSSLAGRVFNAIEKHWVRKAFHGLDKNSAVVDVPCGTGRLAEVLLQEGFKVSGCDISEHMLAVARRKLQSFGSKFEGKVIDARRLPES